MATEVLDEGDIVGPMQSPGPVPPPGRRPSSLPPPPPIAQENSSSSFDTPRTSKPAHDKPWLDKPTALKRTGRDYVTGLRDGEAAARLDSKTKLLMQREKREEEIRLIRGRAGPTLNPNP